MATPIKDAWERFERVVMPENAGPTQRSETRKAFYAGASILFKIVTSGVSSGEEIHEQDLRLLDDIAREVEQYGAELDAAVLGIRHGVQS